MIRAITFGAEITRRYRPINPFSFLLRTTLFRSSRSLQRGSTSLFGFGRSIVFTVRRLCGGGKGGVLSGKG